MSPQNDSNEIQDLSSHHKYRTEIPNIVFDLGLDPYEFKAYCVLKMTAGDKRACWKSNATLCLEVGCQKPKLIEIKKSLAKKGLIIIQKRRKEDKSCESDLIKIVDIWPQNMKYMAEKYPIKEGGGSNPGLPPLVIVDYPPSNRRLPKQDVKEEDVLEQQQPVAASFKIYQCLELVQIPKKDKIEITERNLEIDVKNAIAWAGHPETKIKTTLVQAIKWACQNKPDVPKDKKCEVAENKAYAKKQEASYPNGITVSCLNKCVEIACTQSQRKPEVIEYTEKGFKEQLDNALRKSNINPK